MKDRIREIKVRFSHIGGRSLLVAIAVLLITMLIAAHVGWQIYSTEKQVLLQQGELNAKASAVEYERFILTRENIVRLVGFTVDERLARGASNEEIERYITEETNSIIAALDSGTTGLYGYIRGEYLDGAGWVPDEDYNPIERPWYVETLRSEQQITFVEPYLDAQTGTMMMTVTELLRDGRSVVAMDVTLDPIQLIVEQIAAADEYSQAFVLNERGIVMVHSDEGQLGRDYLKETDGLDAAIARRLLIDGQLQFDLQTDEGAYSVYADKLEGGWYSVSLINASVWYRPLQRVMVAFYLVLFLVVAFLLFVFLHMSAKNLALEQLNTRIDQEERRGEKLQELSEKDRMTGLCDRVSGSRKVEELLAEGTRGMFLELDIDRFKSINDSYGHQTGDFVILAVVDAMRSTFRANDITMRLGGDEFGVFAVGIADQKLGEVIVHRLFKRLEQLEVPELRGAKVCVSVGAALCRDGEAQSFAELYARADNAMYASKRQRGNALHFR